MYRSINLLLMLLLVLFWSCTSCSENTLKTDVDVQDKDTVETDTVSDTDSITDEDPDPDKTDIEVQDSDTDADTDNSAECPDLRIQENVINTPFPFTDKDGKPTFCRPGCDTPTETDPQCVKNIWEWRNWERYQKYLKEEEKNPDQNVIRECYPWPCELPDMKANSTLESFNSKCDRWLTVNGFRADMGTVWSHGMSEGAFGMDLGDGIHLLAMEYYPENDNYFVLGAIGGYISYNEGRFVFMNFETDPSDNPNYRSYAISIEKKDGKYHYELIHDNENHNSYFSRPPFAGKKWVLIQVREGKNGDNTEVKYTKAGVWEWQKIEGIGSPLAQEGNIVGDHLTFITNDREIYYCDLTKSPKHIDDCTLINRKTGTDTFELGHSPRIDMENEYRVVYNIHEQNKFVEVNLADIGNPKHTEYEISKNKETTYAFEPETLRGNRIAYSDYYTMSGGTPDAIGCFYRFDKKKSYCPNEKIFSTSPDSLMGYNTFWGKWHLWKVITSPVAVIRDWECYCEETGVCPLEE